MIINPEGSTVVLIQEKLSTPEFVKQLEEKYDSFKNNHIIVQLSSLKNNEAENISDFLRISKAHKAKKQSFVLVSGELTYNDVPEELSLVPTLQEARDIIAMEDIERDLDL
ncbi:ribonuclease Z [Aquimarina sp. ERC-38]|uniref:ribonuclease Z n=1 Tax=Aquimarina sp. ERC-38 TaxID=2949996 RepID=UPI0022482333|nr:ribonuclease Z [Aquimarina sp. ERC-38]UZO80262.1 ribonuclease Z [Aquimarina sp. ERC-38]